MPWPSWWSSSPQDNDDTSVLDRTKSKVTSAAQAAQAQAQMTLHDVQTTTSSSNRSNDFLSSLTSPPTLVATTVLTTTLLTLFAFRRRYLTRYRDAPSIPQTHYRKRSLFGTVTSVGDGDNFRLYHTPLGRFSGWGILPLQSRTVPIDDKKLLQKNGTVHIRLAGVDAPEAAHFGRPAQPFSKEALEWLTNYVLGRKVRAYVHKPDQYGRAVATVYVRRFPGWRRDVGLEMLKCGLATVYEAKTGVEFGSDKKEKRYREVEEMAKRKGRGMWALVKRDGSGLESPREYKAKYRDTAG